MDTQCTAYIGSVDPKYWAKATQIYMYSMLLPHIQDAGRVVAVSVFVCVDVDVYVYA